MLKLLFIAVTAALLILAPAQSFAQFSPPYTPPPATRAPATIGVNNPNANRLAQPVTTEPPFYNPLPPGGAFGVALPPVVGTFGGFGGWGLGGGGGFRSLAATAGSALGRALGSSLINTAAYDIWLYLQYFAHGYGTGVPQVYPNAGMMAIIEGSPVPPMGASEAAQLRIDAPKDAEVWVNGEALQWSKRGWVYQTGTIAANQIQDLRVRARWGTGNYEINRSANVVLRPGQSKAVTFIGGEEGP